ncbi:P-loop containing nucleoside triphosphate hydrolase protein [Lichtheimia hyalospora FSU 10163]|nr:P-loop containing nucleoside triphosphate hydrolase protein [Lichtheimia hyalospora FSU 10163]
MSNRVLLLVGLPGSGKSTFSNKLIELKPNWRRVNQDDLGSRKNCERHCRRYLDQQLNVVIDRCNFDEQQRSTWIRIAKEYNVPVDCVVLTADKQTCGGRILDRVNHPTGVQGDQGLHILNRFVMNYIPPTYTTNEGIRRIIYLDPSPEPHCTPERVENILLQL